MLDWQRRHRAGRRRDRSRAGVVVRMDPRLAHSVVATTELRMLLYDGWDEHHNFNHAPDAAAARALLVSALAGLLLGMWAGLVRLGWPWPPLSPCCRCSTGRSWPAAFSAR
jgi:hypothetical protein